MTEIVTSKHGKKYNITVDGHASEAHRAEGNIVCAAVSMLVQTLAQNIIDEQINKNVFDVQINFSDGHALIKFTAKNSMSARIFTIYNTVIRGFMLLEKNYPEIIKISEK